MLPANIQNSEHKRIGKNAGILIALYIAQVLLENLGLKECSIDTHMFITVFVI